MKQRVASVRNNNKKKAVSDAFNVIISVLTDDLLI